MLTKEQRALLETSSVPSVTVQRAIAAALADLDSLREEIGQWKDCASELRKTRYALEAELIGQWKDCASELRKTRYALEAELTQSRRISEERIAALEAEVTEARTVAQSRWETGIEEARRPLREQVAALEAERKRDA